MNYFLLESTFIEIEVLLKKNLKHKNSSTSSKKLITELILFQSLPNCFKITFKYQSENSYPD